jgi:branched-chain amino acid transport system permease protein
MGSVYALLGVGFSLTWGVMKVINIAHAAFGLLAAFIAYAMLNAWGIDPVLSTVVTVPMLFVGACLVYRTLIIPITQGKSIIVSSMILTFGIAIILENVMLLIWGPDPRLLNASYTQDVLTLGPFYFQFPKIVACGLAVCGVTATHLFLSHTWTGKAVRASWQQPEAAQLCGVDLRRISMITFAAATATAGLGGIAMANLYSFEPYAHNYWLINLFLVVIAGGLGNILGTAVAGLLIGLITGFCFTFLPYQWVNPMTFGLLMVLLIVRPHGIFRSEM